MSRSDNAWPGVEIVDGPALADRVFAATATVFAVERDGLVLTPRGVVPFYQPLPSFERRVPTPYPGEELLFLDGDRWQRHAPGRPPLAHDDGDVIDVGPWKLALRADVGATITLLRWKSRVLCRPLGRIVNAAALWLLATELQWWITLDDVGFRRRLRRAGASIAALGDRVDPAVARFIARGLHNVERDAGVTFDGVVDGELSVWRDRAPSVEQRFRALTAGSGGSFDGPVAPVDHVAAFVQSVDPVGWQREQLLREECAVAVSMLGPA